MDESIFSESPFDDEEEMDEEGEVYRTYHMDFQNKRIIGKTDGLEAVKQNLKLCRPEDMLTKYTMINTDATL